MGCDGVGREGEGRSSVPALCWRGLGGCWRCSDLLGATGEAAVQEPEAQPGGRGLLPPLAGMGVEAEPQGVELVLPAPMALFGVPRFGPWHVDGLCSPWG